MPRFRRRREQWSIQGGSIQSRGSGLRLCRASAQLCNGRFDVDHTNAYDELGWRHRNGEHHPFAAIDAIEQHAIILPDVPTLRRSVWCDPPLTHSNRPRAPLCTFFIDLVFRITVRHTPRRFSVTMPATVTARSRRIDGSSALISSGVALL